MNMPCPPVASQRKKQRIAFARRHHLNLIKRCSRVWNLRLQECSRTREIRNQACEGYFVSSTTHVFSNLILRYWWTKCRIPVMAKWIFNILWSPRFRPTPRNPQTKAASNVHAKTIKIKTVVNPCADWTLKPKCKLKKSGELKSDPTLW